MAEEKEISQTKDLKSFSLFLPVFFGVDHQVLHTSSCTMTTSLSHFTIKFLSFKRCSHVCMCKSMPVCVYGVIEKKTIERDCVNRNVAIVGSWAKFIKCGKDSSKLLSNILSQIFLSGTFFPQIPTKYIGKSCYFNSIKSGLERWFIA